MTAATEMAAKAAGLPYVLTLEAGKSYRLCQCFHCPDGIASSHCQRPLEIQCEQQQRVWLCSCGRSRQLPWCDGSHNPRQHYTFRQTCRALLQDFRAWWQQSGSD